MKRPASCAAIALALVLWGHVPVARAQDGEPGEAAPEAAVTADVPETAEAPDTPPAPPSSPSSPEERVSRAREAFQNAEFEDIRPLIEDLVGDPLVAGNSSALPDDRWVETLQLLAAVYFFEANQSPDLAQGERLLSRSREQLMRLLRFRPSHLIDPLIYPASIVDFYEQIRREYLAQAEVPEAGSAVPSEVSTAIEVQTLYIQREVRERHLAVNFVPFGVGQFQNDRPVKGTLFAVGQGLALGLNILSYAMVERLRGEDGRFDPGAERTGGDYAQALGWRRVQYASLGTLAALYAWGVLDAVWDFAPARVHIRTLDGPPAELRQ